MKKDVIILAAGVGSRLRPITETIPKTMVEVNGVSIIERLLKQLETFCEQVSSVYILTGYKQKVLSEFISTFCLKNKIVLIENKEYATTNNMFSLYMALDIMDSDAVITVNADCVYEDLIIERMIKANKSCIAVDRSVFLEESMKVKLSKSDKERITGMSKSFAEGDNVQVSIDIYSFNNKTLTSLKQIVKETIESGDKNSWTEVAIDKLAMEEQHELTTIDMTGLKWMEIDNHEDLAKANKIFKQC